MMEFVLDASIALTWCFSDEASEYGDSVLNALAAGTAAAIVPSLWSMEMLNALLVGERRGRLNQALTRQVWENLSALDIREDRGVAPFDSVLPLARDLALSAYDAAYLELALRRRSPLATADVRLKQAAERCGVQPFLPHLHEKGGSQ